MTALAALQLLAFLAVILALAKPLGVYMARVYESRPGGLDRVLGPVERFLYRISGVNAGDEMDWKRYATAMLVFNLAGWLALYALMRLQGTLPANPQHLPAVNPLLDFNTAISFVTNTNWQNYSGERTMSYLTQMLGLAVQNFLSAASGMAVLVALIRGFARRSATTVGNFWVDTVRGTLYILLPLSLVFALALVSQGVVQTFSAYKKVALLEPVTVTEPRLDAAGAPVKDAKGNPVTEKVTVIEQTLALGPAASQIAIKQLGTNGGGFFNVNSAHPFENPTPLSDFLELVAILLLPAALCLTLGEMVRDRRQGWAILAAMVAIFVVFAVFDIASEQAGNPLLTRLGVDQRPSATQGGGNMEGKEVRFGPVASALWATATTAASNGSVNAMHDSFTPLGGLVPMALMQIGEVVFGGVGSGLYGMLAFVIVAVFIAGLMVGRTPEYLGKKIGSFEMKMASLVILVPPVVVLLGTALAVATAAGRAATANPEAHGFSEILYAFSSAANNNGSAFAGLSGNTPFYNFTLGLAMFFGRFWTKVPILAIAGSLAAKKMTPAGAGTLATHTPLFVVLLVGTVLLVAALTFLPALALGPIVEHLQMLAMAR
ncbi:MAG TPA: potassium-transporting ATPase subunit KdpA [Thermoanaerobaculaceae bacterium]|nr:potassium-transporting ATPase subunit KdpA [Thermoanaerobaculaceae bacterium]